MFKHLLNYHTLLERQLEKISANAITALDFRVIRHLHQAQTCPAPLLPWLAWELSVDYWDDSWSENIKRDVTEASISVHRKKGTIESVQQALKVAGLDAVVDVSREQADYVPHSFRLQLSTETNAPTTEHAQIVRYQVGHVKPARCSYSLHFNEAGLTTSPCPHVSVLPIAKEQLSVAYHQHQEPSLARRDRHTAALVVLREAA